MDMLHYNETKLLVDLKKGKTDFYKRFVYPTLSTEFESVRTIKSDVINNINNDVNNELKEFYRSFFLSQEIKKEFKDMNNLVRREETKY